MKLLIKNGRIVDPATQRDEFGDLAIAAGRIVAIGSTAAQDFAPNRVIDATGCIVAPGLVDLAARLGEPGHEHEGMLESELAAAVAGGITSLVCPPDTDPVLDEPGLVDMLKTRAEKMHRARLYPLGALTRGLKGAVLTEMVVQSRDGTRCGLAGGVSWWFDQGWGGRSAAPSPGPIGVARGSAEGSMPPGSGRTVGACFLASEARSSSSSRRSGRLVP